MDLLSLHPLEGKKVVNCLVRPHPPLFTKAIMLGELTSAGRWGRWSRCHYIHNFSRRHLASCKNGVWIIKICHPNATKKDTQRA